MIRWNKTFAVMESDEIIWIHTHPIALPFLVNFRPLQWRHNGRDCVSNHQPHDCLLNRLYRRISKKPQKLRVTGLCAGNSLGTGELPAQMASYAENVSIWWRHHTYPMTQWMCVLDFQYCCLNTFLTYRFEGWYVIIEDMPCLNFYLCVYCNYELPHQMTWISTILRLSDKGKTDTLCWQYQCHIVSGYLHY